ncbi:hypothetical protein [Streptococcus thoraltensis]|uniref:alpha-L-rhamnosidase-related protein n=1 Tax=Streptococcus thoraltensis TaxID=55085 RepID=UPI003BF5A1F3
MPLYVQAYDRVYENLFKEEAPSWLFEVNMGETTTWERWDSFSLLGQVSFPFSKRL